MINQPSLLRRIFSNRQTRIGVVIMFIGFSTYFLATLFRVGSYEMKEAYTLYMLLRIIPYVIIITGLGFFLLGYLEGFSPMKRKLDSSRPNAEVTDYRFEELKDMIINLRSSEERDQDRRESNLSNTISILNQKVQELTNLQLNEKQKDELFISIRDSFSKNINSDFFKELNENISSEITKEKRNRLEFLFKESGQIKFRLSGEVEKLGRRANLNLVIGSLTTIVALITLSYIVFQKSTPFTSWLDMAYHYVPRISLIIFVEIFSYFFLKLYKSNLNDIKYYQNELTTVELKLSSIATAINFGKDIDISAIVSELSKTERNFILKKDETTVDIEKAKLDKDDLKDILKFTTEIVNKK